VELIDATGVADPQIETMALSFLSELRSGGLGGNIYIESLANLLVVHLLRHHSSLKQPLLPPPGGLASTTKRRVITYIEEHLAEDLSLSAIATVANLSPYHFARLFKESRGLSLHQYVISRRVERAKLLLATANWSLTTIAHAVCFAHESHLALHFERLTGFTPKHAR
jgi:AraC family transcriptional regulator